MNASTSVISAAVVGGDLILGLSDGAIINAGRVQGPKGLTGEQGPMGATGLRGTDGNTILTFEGAPQPFAGKDGDFAINVVAWEIYGPKAAGQWGKGTPLRGDTRSGRGNGERAAFDSPGAGGNGQGGGTFYNTANLSLAGTGRDGIPETKAGRITAPGGNIIPEGKNLTYQSNLNAWVFNSLSALDEALPVGKVDTLPDKGKYEGDMVLFEGALWIWSGGAWIEVGGAVDVSDFATKEYVNKTAFATTSVAATQADWLNQTYSSGTWVLQTGGAASPNLQRYILTGEDFADTAELGKAKYVSVHALGGGDFIHYQNEKPGDTIQIYGNPLSGDKIASFGIYEIEEITEHNFPDNPDDDGADFSDAFISYTVKPLAFYGTVEEDEMCQIKTMPPVGAVGGGGSDVHVGENPPEGATEGALWYDSTRLELFVYYVDPDDNGKWLASGGPKVDGEFVSKKGGDAMEGPLHVKGHSGDSRGTSRIKTLGIFSDSNSALRLGTTTDRIYVEDENTKFNGGVLVNNIGPKTEDGRGVTLNVEGNNDKHLVTKGYVDDGDKALQDQIDDCVKQSASWDMSLGTTLGVNQLKPLDDGTPFVYYEPRDWDSTHPCGIVNRGLMENYVDDAIDGIEFPEADLSDYVSKSGDEITGQLTINKSTQVALDIIGDNNISQIKFWSSGAIALQNYTAFKDNELVTKKYVDENAGGITPGDQVAKTNGTNVEVGGFYINMGNLYVRVS